VLSALISELAELAELVWPCRCVACGASNVAWCASCRGEPRRRRIEAGTDVAVFAGGDYEGPLRSAILGYKERGRRELARPLAEWLAVAVQGVSADDVGPRSGDRPVVLVPVPSSTRARVARGGDHLVPLARWASRRTGHPLVRALALNRPVLDSAGLGIAARARNLEQAMIAGRPPGRSQAIVVDDIVTTGASLREAVRALRESGWTVAGAAAIAATGRRYRSAREAGILY
jgi:predicted amidophosphoribosyltransferase